MMPTYAYPAGGELSLSVCIAASSALNSYGAALGANDQAGSLTQITGSIETQLESMRKSHSAGSDAQPFADRLRAALEAVSDYVPDEEAKILAEGLARKVWDAISRGALTSPGPAEKCCQFAFAVADDAYADHGARVSRDLGFAIKPSPEDLAWHGVTGKVGGTTTLRDGPGMAEVGLILSLRLPWHGALDAIPYVLVHECVAHAFRGPSDSTEDTGAGSMFAEGWMDWVALLLLTRAIRHGAAPALPWPWSETRDIEQRVASAHMERRAPRDPNPQSRLQARRNIGIVGATVLERTISNILNSNWPSAQDEFLRLSLLLNASAISPGARDALAWRMYSAQGDTHADWLKDLVRAWRDDGLPPPDLFRA